MRRPPHLPFVSGPPEFQVGLKPIPVDAWLAPDHERESLAEKRALIRARRGEVYRTSGDVEACEREVERLIVAAIGGERDGDASPLVRAAQLVTDDLVVMTRAGEDWRAASLVLCSPTFFSAADAIGKSLDGLHEPVPDRLGPQATQALGARIGRVFLMLRDDLVLERFNWTVQASGARFTPEGAPLRALAAQTPAEAALDVMHLRVERQTIRKLPETGGVLFTIRISLDPLRAVFAVGGARDAFAEAWEGAPAHVRTYKKWDAYERLVRAALKA